MPSWEPDPGMVESEIYFSKRLTAAVLFMSGCFLGLGLILYFYG